MFILFLSFPGGCFSAGAGLAASLIAVTIKLYPNGVKIYLDGAQIAAI
jgi:hypothetical protein